MAFWLAGLLLVLALGAREGAQASLMSPFRLRRVHQQPQQQQHSLIWQQHAPHPRAHQVELERWLQRDNGATNHSPATIVTALMDIGRAGRGIETYKGWFSHVLAIRTPMVVFVNREDVRDWVLEQRMGLATIVFLQPLEDMPCYWLLPYVEYITKQPDFKQRLLDNSGGALEYNMPLYIPTVWSKFGWMERVAYHNPFNSTLFFWVDAGAGRWSAAAENKHWPNMAKVKQLMPELLEPGSTKFVIQAGLKNGWPQEFNATYAMYSNQNFVGAAIMGGSAAAVNKIYRQGAVFLKEWIRLGMIGNEQTFLYCSARKEPEQFNVVWRQCPPENCQPGLEGYRADDSAVPTFDWLA